MLETFVIPILGSLLAGGLIGFEREYKSRPAGLRTHTLVALASTLLMLAAARQGDWDITFFDTQDIVTDPTRMAHGILTGIGFLCAGVIFRHGFSIQGLTTATTLWMTSALGMLFGVGLWGLASVGTAVTLVVLVLFRLFYRYLPRRNDIDVIVRLRGDGATSGQEIEALLRGLGLRAEAVRQRLLGDADVLEVAFKVVSPRGLHLETMVDALRGVDDVRGFELAPREE
ncbi:MgtC/SapB family protein [Coralloluteibacterium thermophilus]|uniref:Protein MgtC n=1 Tax=Coralloluteibacterium thermophilum TaxID=2707049 RepID=A0ABV9NH20_9GAMM